MLPYEVYKCCQNGSLNWLISLQDYCVKSTKEESGSIMYVYMFFVRVPNSLYEHFSLLLIYCWLTDFQNLYAVLLGKTYRNISFPTAFELIGIQCRPSRQKVFYKFPIWINHSEASNVYCSEFNNAPFPRLIKRLKKHTFFSWIVIVILRKINTLITCLHACFWSSYLSNIKKRK